jgi:molybdate transport system substrate-binding protein
VNTRRTSLFTDYADFRRLLGAGPSSICENLRNLWIFLLELRAVTVRAEVDCRSRLPGGISCAEETHEFACGTVAKLKFNGNHFLRREFSDSIWSSRLQRSRPAGGTYWRVSFIAVLVCLSIVFAGCGDSNKKLETGSPKSDAASFESGAVTAENPKAARQLRIAAASDLKFALADIVSAFERLHPEATVTVTYGSSGNFFAQLSNEAPFDLFLSADIAYPRQLVEQGRGVPNSDFSYATGHLVLWVPKDSVLDVEKKGIEIVRDAALQKVAVANPRTAPYGRAAVAALKSLGVYDDVEERLVYGENVAQTAQMVESGGADAGLIALSLAISPVLKGKGRFWQIPDSAHPPIEQGGVVLTWALDAGLAVEFRDFLLSGAGQDILRQFGFVPAGG